MIDNEEVKLWRGHCFNPKDYDAAVAYLIKNENETLDTAIDFLNIMIGTCISEKEPFCTRPDSKLIITLVEDNKVVLAVSFSI